MATPHALASRKAAEAAVACCDYEELQKILAEVERPGGTCSDEVGHGGRSGQSLADTDITNGFSLLHLACALPNADHIAQTQVVRVLLDYGAQINATDRAMGYSALHWACRGQNISLVQFLLSHGANPTMKTVRQQQALDVAMHGGLNCASMVHVLLKWPQEPFVVENIMRMTLSKTVQVRMLDPGRRWGSRKWSTKYMSVNQNIAALSVWSNASAQSLFTYLLSSSIVSIRVQKTSREHMRVDIYHEAQPNQEKIRRISFLFVSLDGGRHQVSTINILALQHKVLPAATIQAVWRGFAGRQVAARARVRREQAHRLVLGPRGEMQIRLQRAATELSLLQHESSTSVSSPSPPLSPVSPSSRLSRHKSFNRVRRLVKFSSSTLSTGSSSKGNADRHSSGSQLTRVLSEMTSSADLQALYEESLPNFRPVLSDKTALRAVLRMQVSKSPLSLITGLAMSKVRVKLAYKPRLVEASRELGGLAYWRDSDPAPGSQAKQFIPFNKLLDVRIRPGNDSPTEWCEFFIRTIDDFHDTKYFATNSRSQADTWVNFLRSVLPRENLAALVIQTRVRTFLAIRSTARLREGNCVYSRSR